METVKATSETVVCTLTEEDKRARLEDLRNGLLRLIETARETEDGIALGFPPESAEMLREFVAFERSCCSFVTYTIDDRDDDRTWLRLSGPEGTRQFVRGWLPAEIFDR